MIDQQPSNVMPEPAILQNVTGDHNIFSATGDVYVFSQPDRLSPEDAKQRRNLQTLLERVREIWIDGVLKNSLHNTVLLDLHTQAIGEAVTPSHNPVAQVYELADRPPRFLFPDEKIIDLFDHWQGGLLILGEPGSGKTTAALQLTSELIDRVEQGGSFEHPIPVPFNLSSWTKEQSLMDWMVEQLLAIYDIPRRFGRRWFRENRLLPILDGLDEVRAPYQADCVEAINLIEEQLGLAGLVVCSRLEEYMSLPDRLKLKGAICLQPLTTDQVEHYLAESGEELAALRTTLREDDSLRTLATSPLMLGIMTLAYKGMSPQELTSHALDTLEERRRHLFDTYVERMFKRKGQGDKPYPDQQVKDGLRWLAQGMKRHNQSIFLIEKLQPSWLSDSAGLLWYPFLSRFITVLLLGLIFVFMERASLVSGIGDWLLFGILGGAGLSVIDFLRLVGVLDALPNILRRAITIIATVLLFGLIGVLVERIDNPSNPPFVAFLVYGLVLGLFLGWKRAQRGLEDDIQAVERVGWSWKLGALIGIAGASVGTLVAVLLDAPVIRVVAIFGALGAFYGGLQGRRIGETSKPNQGMRRSAQNALIYGLGTGGIITLLLAGIAALSDSGAATLGNRLSDALVLGIPAALWFGGFEVINHYTLRLLLYLKEGTCLNYAHFLDYATRMIFLQKTGGGFMFYHRLLQDHFAQGGTGIAARTIGNTR